MEARIQTLRTLIVKEQRNQDQDQRIFLSPVVCFFSAFKSNRTSVVDGAAFNLLNFEKATTERRP